MQMDPESEYVLNSLKICSVIISDTENGTKTVTSSHLKGEPEQGPVGLKRAPDNCGPSSAGLGVF